MRKVIFVIVHGIHWYYDLRCDKDLLDTALQQPTRFGARPLWPIACKEKDNDDNYCGRYDNRSQPFRFITWFAAIFGHVVVLFTRITEHPVMIIFAIAMIIVAAYASFLELTFINIQGGCSQPPVACGKGRNEQSILLDKNFSLGFPFACALLSTFTHLLSIPVTPRSCRSMDT